MSTFGQRLKALRKAADLTQAELATKAKINRVTLVELEKDRAVPSWETAIALAAALGKSTADFEAPPDTSVLKPLVRILINAARKKDKAAPPAKPAKAPKKKKAPPK